MVGANTYSTALLVGEKQRRSFSVSLILIVLEGLRKPVDGLSKQRTEDFEVR
jgi:hypothetical protein